MKWSRGGAPFQEKDLAASTAPQPDPQRTERLVARPQEMIYNQDDLKGETAIQAARP